MRTIIISAGHCPEKTGASWQSLHEHFVAMEWIREISLQLAFHGVDHVMIEPGTLTEKVKRVNRVVESRDKSLAVELHFNSAGPTYVQGNETLYHPHSELGRTMADAYNVTFMNGAKKWVIKDRGVKAGWYQMVVGGSINYWLKATACPALILEPCFMCQLNEIGSNWKNCCMSIVDGLIEAAKIS